jgi:hypothetical protein
MFQVELKETNGHMAGHDHVKIMNQVLEEREWTRIGSSSKEVETSGNRLKARRLLNDRW